MAERERKENMDKRHSLGRNVSEEIQDSGGTVIH